MSKTWDSNCRQVANHIQQNCKTLEDAWSVVGDLGEKALKQYDDGSVLSTKELSQAIGELVGDAREELDRDATRPVRTTNAWDRHKKHFTREAGIRDHIGNLTVTGDGDGDVIVRK